MNKKIENKLKEIVEPILKQGRPGDFEHTMRVLDIGKHLLKHEKGDEEIVIPAIYLHDLGYSRIEYEEALKMVPTPDETSNDNREMPSWKPPEYVIEKLRQHMKHSASMAKEILDDLGYDAELTDRIVTIISVHDDNEKLFALGDDSAILLFEADRLDRLHPEGNKRIKLFKKLMPGTQKPQVGDKMKQRMDKMVKNHWFRTETAKKLGIKWLERL